MIYGYCRISTNKQNIERQVKNIQDAYADAKIVKEIFTGTKVQGRKKFKELIKKVKSGDTIVFDEVSRMARNTEEGLETYFELFDRGVNLIFLKEPYVNTDIYKTNMQDKIELTNTDEDEIFKGINNYFRKLAKNQIRIAFEQAQKEVDYLKERTREGIASAREDTPDLQIGRKKGTKITTKKSKEAKKIIREHNRSFGGTLTNEETWTLAKINRMTFYKYKKEVEAELLKELG